MMADEVHTGSGDDIVALTSTGPRIFRFECPNCDGNVIVHSNGGDMGLINEIGAYTGKILIDAEEDSKTTEVEVKVDDGDWTMTLSDIRTVGPVSGRTEGAGDDVVRFSSTGTKAKITHSGDGNFIVHGYGGNRIEGAVNEIGDYEGTVKLTTPGFVQVHAEPGTTWTIEPA